MVGAKPVFADIDPVSMNIDPEQIASKITSKTKAIIPVEVFGNPAMFDEISKVAAGHNIPILEDCCEALGSSLNGKKCGTFGIMSAYAFYPNKQMTTGEGGMILTDDDALADMCCSLRNQGRGKSGGWLGHERLGYNFRLSDINCALGIAQLSRIEEMKKARRKSANLYQELLAEEERIILPVAENGCDVNWFVYVIRLAEQYTQADRDAVMKAMLEAGVQVSNYFTPVHLQPFMVEQFGYKKGDFPVTDNTCERTIALPFYNNLSREDANTICDALRTALDKISK
jgi:perosamine synthetase